MEKKTSPMQDFEQFSTDKLNIHLAELNTNYENEAIDKQTLQKAYSEHKEIFRQELDEKINDLNSGQGDQWLHIELKSTKDTYLDKLYF